LRRNDEYRLIRTESSLVSMQMSITHTERNMCRNMLLDWPIRNTPDLRRINSFVVIQRCMCASIWSRNRSTNADACSLSSLLR
jgi:hypothetical protein